MKHSLSVKMNIFMIAVVTSIFLLFGAYEVFQIRTIHYADLKESLSIISDRLGTALITPLWMFDEETMVTVVSSEMRDKNVYAILVRNASDNNTIILGKIRDQAWQSQDVVQPDFTLPEGFLTQTVPISKGNETLGIVEVHLTKKFLDEQIWRALTTRAITLLLLLSAVVITLAAVITMQVTRPLKRLTLDFEAVTQGNLEQAIQASRSDEIGRLAKSFLLMRDSIREKMKELHNLNAKLDQEVAARTAEVNALQNLLNKVRNTAEHLESTSKTMTAISTQMATGADQLSKQVQVVSSSSQEISHNVHNVSAATEEVAVNIREISRNIQEVTAIIEEAVNTANASHTTIASLETRSQEIGQIIQVITAITQQTNLLALNAAIEAARAGETGKGFSVVANEVKELARETAASAEDITRKIEAIQDSSQEASAAMLQVADMTKRVSELANYTATAISQQSIAANDISHAIFEVTGGSEEITHTMSEVSATARESFTRATNVLHEAQALASLAQELHELVNAFGL